MSDAYTWVVHYRDGSAIGQINDQGVDDGSWRKVDVRNVAMIRLDPTRPELPLHGVLVPDGATAHLRFQRGHTLDPNTGTQTPNPVMIIVGWERYGDAAYLWIDHDGNTALNNDRDVLEMPSP